MKITPLNEFNTLFKVEDVYLAEVIADCQQQNIDTFPWEPLAAGSIYSHANTTRRMLISEPPNVFATLNGYVQALIPEITEITGKSISNCCTRVWADYPGYTVSKHLDNDGIYISLQVYLNEGDETLGTHFSNSDVGLYQHAIPYRPNFGYIMVNTSYNFHGMIRPVPDNFIRLSSYTWFGA